MKTRFALLFFTLVLVASSCAPSEPPPSQEPVYNSKPPVSAAPTPAPTSNTPTETVYDFDIGFAGLDRTEDNPEYGNSPFALVYDFSKPPSPYYDEATNTMLSVDARLPVETLLEIAINVEQKNN